MSSYLNKLLAGRKQEVAARICRILGLITFFGGIFYFKNNKNLSEILIFTGVGLSVVYTILNLIVRHNKKQLLKPNAE